MWYLQSKKIKDRLQISADKLEQTVITKRIDKRRMKKDVKNTERNVYYNKTL